MIKYDVTSIKKRKSLIGNSSYNVVTRREHSRGPASHSILPLLSEIGNLPHKHTIIRGCGHLPHFPFHLHDGQVPQAHCPLQLTNLQHRTDFFIYALKPMLNECGV